MPTCLRNNFYRGRLPPYHVIKRLKENEQWRIKIRSFTHETTKSIEPLNLSGDMKKYTEVPGTITQENVNRYWQELWQGMVAEARPLTPGPTETNNVQRTSEGWGRPENRHSAFPQSSVSALSVSTIGPELHGGKWTSQKHHGERVMTPICGHCGALWKPAISVLMLWRSLSLSLRFI